MDRSFVDAFRKDFPMVLTLSVAHCAAARERIPVTRPAVVVVASAVTKVQLQEVVDAAAAVGAELIRMTGDSASPVSYFRIKKALIEHQERKQRALTD